MMRKGKKKDNRGKEKKRAEKKKEKKKGRKRRAKERGEKGDRQMKRRENWFAQYTALYTPQRISTYLKP